MPPRRKAPFDRQWHIRRAVVIGTVLWCPILVTYLSIWGEDRRTVDTTISGCLLLMASVIGSYVFGAVWDDRNRDKARWDSQDFDVPYQRETYRERVTVPSKTDPADPEPPEGYAG